MGGISELDEILASQEGLYFTVFLIPLKYTCPKGLVIQ
jgi:hypothetical protein